MISIEMKVQSRFSELSRAEQSAASYFLEHKEDIFRYPLATLAKMSNTSQGAWVRFCKDIGYDGLKGLKKALYEETSQTSAEESGAVSPILFYDIRQCTSVQSTAEYICANAIQAIETTLKLLNEETIEKVAELLIAADSIRCFGLAASGLVAEDLYSKFLRLGYHAFYAKDLHMAYSSAATSTPSDAAILISNSGETEEILRIVKLLKASSTPTVAITQYGINNPLAQQADYVLYTNSMETILRGAATSSRISQLCLVDILFMTVASRDYPQIERNLKQSYESCHQDHTPVTDKSEA
ncbi:MAG: MurR/RpiR family transcriptional regulator [Lachnospiraceae bacterium]|nr:MurR/RpiR family transcriptional regulator [Lachnospiraceae bacterium]